MYGNGPAAPPPPPGPPTVFGDPNSYSATDAIAYGWNKFKENAGIWILATLVVFAVVGAISFVTESIFPSTTSTFDNPANDIGPSYFVGAFTSNLVTTLVSGLIGAILIKGALGETAGRKFSFDDMFSGIDYGQVLLASLLTFVGTMVGLVLCVIPGLIFAVLTMFTMYFVIDQQQSAIDAIKSSISLVRAHLGDSLLLLLLVFLVVLAGLLACCVGLLAAAPIASIAMAYTYKRFIGQQVF